MSRDGIFKEIDAERSYQEARWGNDNDDKNTLTDWVAYLSYHASRWFPGGYPPYDAETMLKFRTQMIKVAALAVAAIEATDRNNSNA